MDPKNKMTSEQQKLNTPPAPRVVADKITKTRNDLGVAFKEFYNLLKDKVLDKHKSSAHRNTEKQAIDNLYKIAVSLEQQNVTEGVFAVAMIALRTNLAMRDRINELEYTLYSTIKELKKIQPQIAISTPNNVSNEATNSDKTPEQKRLEELKSK